MKLVVLSFIAIILVGCAAPPREITSEKRSDSADQSASTTQTTPAQSTSSEQVPQSSGQPQWTKPAKWTEGPQKQMRLATYIIPSAKGDTDTGECAVFGAMGGGVDGNANRWISQFTQPKSETKTETINGKTVTIVKVNGTYDGGAMMTGAANAKKSGYMLLGAIFGNGEAFVKITGPEKTLKAAEPEFEEMLKSFKF